MSEKYITDLVSALYTPALLSREEFVAKYMPQYVRPYESPTGIRLKYKNRHSIGVPITSTPGSKKAQVTKRDNRINTAYEQYIRMRQQMIDSNSYRTEEK